MAYLHNDCSLRLRASMFKGLSFTDHISLVFFLLFVCVVPKKCQGFLLFLFYSSFFCISFSDWVVCYLFLFVLNTLELTVVVATSLMSGGRASEGGGGGGGAGVEGSSSSGHLLTNRTSTH